jgi:hypothetical protein
MYMAFNMNYWSFLIFFNDVFFLHFLRKWFVM